MIHRYNLAFSSILCLAASACSPETSYETPSEGPQSININVTGTANMPVDAEDLALLPVTSVPHSSQIAVLGNDSMLYLTDSFGNTWKSQDIPPVTSILAIPSPPRDTMPSIALDIAGSESTKIYDITPEHEVITPDAVTILPSNCESWMQNHTPQWMVTDGGLNYFYIEQCEVSDVPEIAENISFELLDADKNWALGLNNGSLGLYDATSLEFFAPLKITKGITTPGLDGLANAIAVSPSGFGGSAFAEGIVAIADNNNDRLVLVSRGFMIREIERQLTTPE